MSADKNVWQRPELVVLARSRPEEAVLVTCKFAGLSGPGRPAVQACVHPASGNCVNPSSS